MYRMDMAQTMARLDMQGQNARLSTGMPPASLNMDSTPGKMEIEADHPQLSVDAAEAKAEEGYVPTPELVNRFADQGEQDAQAAARQYNAWGRVYRSMARNKHAIARYALDQAVPAMPTYGLRFVPSQLPRISFSDNILSYSYQPKVLRQDWDTHQTASISVDQPAQLSIWLARQPELHFSVQA